MMKKNSSPEIEMLLMAELISYPYHLGRVNLESLTSLIVSPHARKVLGVLVEMRKNDEEVTLVNVAYHLKDSDVTAILTKSTQNVTTDASIYQHIDYLKELRTVRFLEMLAMKIVQVSGDMSLSSSEKFNKLIDELNHEADMLSECRSLHHIGEVMNEIADDIQKRASEQASGNVIRVPTGIDELDRFLYGGFGPGNLIVLAGRPSEGKSALMVHMAQAAAMAGVPALIFSLEMSKEEVVQRFMVSTGYVRPEQIHQAKVEDWSAFEQGITKLCNLPIYVDDTTKSVGDMVAKVNSMKAKGKCGIVFIDYLGLLRFEGTQPLYQQISQATKTFKRLAKDCRCPVVLLCQLNRNNVKEKRPPQLQDLRDSGSIEQDADIVLMIERKEGRDLDLWLRKNRHGYGGEVCLELTHDNLYSNFKSRGE